MGLALGLFLGLELADRGGLVVIIILVILVVGVAVVILVVLVVLVPLGHRGCLDRRLEDADELVIGQGGVQGLAEGQGQGRRAVQFPLGQADQGQRRAGLGIGRQRRRAPHALGCLRLRRLVGGRGPEHKQHDRQGREKRDKHGASLFSFQFRFHHETPPLDGVAGMRED